MILCPRSLLPTCNRSWAAIQTATGHQNRLITCASFEFSAFTDIAGTRQRSAFKCDHLHKAWNRLPSSSAWMRLPWPWGASDGGMPFRTTVTVRNRQVSASRRAVRRMVGNKGLVDFAVSAKRTVRRRVRIQPGRGARISSGRFTKSLRSGKPHLVRFCDDGRRICEPRPQPRKSISTESGIRLTFSSHHRRLGFRGARQPLRSSCKPV